MGREKLVIANWKMNSSLDIVNEFLDKIRGCNFDEMKGKLVIAPSFPYLSMFSSILDSNIYLGAQDCSFLDSSIGNYTGDVSSSMLSEVGCGYVMVGHSERRLYHKENEEILSAKLESVSSCGMIPILCIGENKEEHDSGELERVLDSQLAVLDGTNYGNIVIAYEPVWSIGSGLVPSLEHIKKINKFILEVVEQKLYLDRNVSLLYGGSVNVDNISKLMMIDSLDGVLVGGASLKFDELWKIAKQVIN